MQKNTLVSQTVIMVEEEDIKVDNDCACGICVKCSKIAVSYFAHTLKQKSENTNNYQELRNNLQNFYVHAHSKLDFDAFPGPTYRFIVHAKDSGIPALSSSVDVTVTTSNVNDEQPNIIPPGTLVLRDMVPENFILTRLRATDADGDNVKFYFTRK